MTRRFIAVRKKDDVMNLRVIANYYQQFDADYSLKVPEEGYGGWKRAEVELAPEHTAVVVMHAWDIGTYEDYPGWHRACGEVPATYEVCRTVFPGLLSAVRASDMALFHVVGGGDYYKPCPGYKRAVDLAGPASALGRMASDPALDRLRKFHSDRVFVGAHNQEDYRRGSPKRTFPKEAVPMDHEGVAENGHQLFALCREAGVNHLIYAGFNINMCVLVSPGGMVDMSQRGIMCSALKQAVTAVESRESARQGWGKEMGLWFVAVCYGFVFDVEDFIRAIEKREA
jgi:hypothetical protein